MDNPVKQNVSLENMGVVRFLKNFGKYRAGNLTMLEIDNKSKLLKLRSPLAAVDESFKNPFVLEFNQIINVYLLTYEEFLAQDNPLTKEITKEELDAPRTKGKQINYLLLETLNNSSNKETLFFSYDVSSRIRKFVQSLRYVLGLPQE